MGGFSSFGPALAGDGDLLKPDITAPGVDVIAAVAPPGNAGMNFNAYDGTSMSSPHIAGIAALIMQKHPTWSPMGVKSAMMTGATRSPTRATRSSGARSTPRRSTTARATSCRPSRSTRVWSTTRADDWMRYGCGIGQFQRSRSRRGSAQRRVDRPE